MNGDTAENFMGTFVLYVNSRMENFLNLRVTHYKKTLKRNKNENEKIYND